MPSPAASRHTRGVASSLPTLSLPPADQGDETPLSLDDTNGMKHDVATSGDVRRRGIAFCLGAIPSLDDCE